MKRKFLIYWVKFTDLVVSVVILIKLHTYMSEFLTLKKPKNMKKLLLLPAAILLSLNLIAQIPSNGLVGYYPFSGNANDFSGNNNNGTVNGATLTSDRFGKLNSAYSFNGLGNSISIPHNNTMFDFTDSMSISIWYLIKNLNYDTYNKFYAGRLIDKVTNNASDGYWSSAISSTVTTSPYYCGGAQSSNVSVNFGLTGDKSVCNIN
jgi:hypothetical protein